MSRLLTLGLSFGKFSEFFYSKFILKPKIVCSSFTNLYLDNKVDYL